MMGNMVTQSGRPKKVRHPNRRFIVWHADITRSVGDASLGHFG